MNFFVDESQIKNDKIYVQGSDINHIKNVLRYKEKDIINIVSKTSKIKYVTQIEEFLKDKIKCNILEEIRQEEMPLKIDIFQGLPKFDKMELIIQKCSELGVNKIIPVEMKRCIVKLNEKDTIKKINRWQTISQIAAKQCQRADILEIGQICDIGSIKNTIKDYDIVLVLYEKEENVFLKNELEKLKNMSNINIAIVIGPEGGFEEQEVKGLIESGAKSMSLGKRILRTETAPIVISSILMYELGDIGGSNVRRS